MILLVFRKAIQLGTASLPGNRNLIRSAINYGKNKKNYAPNVRKNYAHGNLNYLPSAVRKNYAPIVRKNYAFDAI